jgi:non-specific serine/threonine protein kinase
MSADASIPSGSPTPFHPLAPATRVQNLPRPLSAFVGRESELAALRALLDDGVRLITVTGPGGSGKTRLAIELARGVSAAFADGVCFVSMAATREPELVPIAVADALRVPRAGDQRVEDRLHAFLGSKELLLVLDNLEHLLPATPLIADLLSRQQALTVLATSRSPLGLTGEHVYSLAPPSPGDARSLFVQRTRSASGQLDDGSHDAALVDTICARLDRIPLAIELAAARTTVLDLATLNQRLDRRLPMLSGGPRDAPERQRTMRDAIAWSYDLLDEPTQTAFRRLSVFVGGFTLDAAGAVALDGADALDLLESLVSRSLIVRTPSTAGGPRFAMYETIRDSGWERLRECGDEETTRTRHADWLVAMTEAAIPFYDGPELLAHHQAVVAEFDNIRAALTWLLEVCDAERAIRLSGAIWRNWWSMQTPGSTTQTERLEEGLSWIERALALDHDLPVEHVTEALAGAARHASMLGLCKRARGFLDTLLQRSQAEQDRYGEYWAWLNLAFLAGMERHFPGAEAAAIRALHIAPEIRDPDNQTALALGTLGDLATARGDKQAAVDRLTDALAHARLCGNPFVWAYTASKLGTALWAQGRYAEAAARLTESLAQMANLSDSGTRAYPLLQLARVAIAKGQPVEAIYFLAAGPSPDGSTELLEILDQVLTTVKATVPDPGFTEAWEAGRSLGWDEVMALAHSLANEEGAGVVAPEVPLHGLTPRETDVLRLLTTGKSNRAIAQALSISERTVENHVFHFLAKLGLDSRTAAAAWAVRNGLAE